MANVNIANNSWSISRQTTNISVTADSSSVYFIMGGSNEMRCAKACVAINASNYNKITLTCSNTENVAISDIYFGVFDSMSAEYYYNTQYDNGIRSSSLSGIGVTAINPNYSGTITINIPSGTTGTKYVGFLFYGNTYNASARPRKRINISSLTATERGYTLTYNANGGSNAPSSVSNVTSMSISSIIPTRSGYDFLGWSTSSTATSASYVTGNTISLSSNITLYAVWRKFYTVTYYANGGSDAPSSSKKIDGQTLILTTSSPTPPGNTSVTHEITLNTNGGTCGQDMITVTNPITYKFVNWNTRSDGSGTTYQAGGSYTGNSDLTLYAQYKPTTTSNSVTLPTPFRNNYDFLGWSTDEYSASGITGTYTPTGDITLYAIWKIRGQVYICDKLEGFSPYKVLIYDGSGWNQYVPYIYTYSGWEIYSG